MHLSWWYIRLYALFSMISAVDILPRHIQTKLVLRPGGQIG